MEKNIETVTVEELLSRDTGGSIPILVDIEHSDIVWNDGSSDQEDGHLRLINANYTVKYDGHTYRPSVFTFTLPSEDGKKVGSTTITISAIDQRVIEVIRSVETKPTATIVAFFSKEDSTITFSKIYNYVFEMDSVSWDGVSAKWSLVFDPVMNKNIPRDLATAARCPAVNTES